MADSKKTAGRLAFIDWTRGFAALVMLQGHTFDSFTRTDLRTKGPFMLSQFFGGLPPALFLFLTGITFAFLMDSQSRSGGTTWGRIVAALKRSRYLFLLAFLFRIQLYVFGFPTSPADQLLKVDILNCMGFAMLVMAPMAVFTTVERIRLCTVLGIVIAGLSPVVSMINPNAVPSLVHAYLFPSYTAFGFFPWGAFLAFGMVAGSVIRIVPHEELGRALGWFLGVGIGVALVAQQLSSLPYSIYSKSEFWLNSPALTAIKVGIILSILAVSYLWVNLCGVEKWSLLRQLGTTSLLIYWVHIELVYGRWFGIWKQALSVPQVVTFTVLLIALMTLLSIGQTRWSAIVKFFRNGSLPQPEHAAGD